MSLTLGYDCTAANYSKTPGGHQVAGYTTGTPDIAWTAAMFAAHAEPTAVRICQDAGATDTTADVLDVETGAATIAEAPAWFRAALQNYEKGSRPGQRYPCIYASASNITPIANALVAAGIIANGPALWVASWNIADPAALVTDTGPYPIVGIQFASNGTYDSDLWEPAWLATVSAAPAPVRTLVSVMATAAYSDGSTESWAV